MKRSLIIGNTLLFAACLSGCDDEGTGETGDQAVVADGAASLSDERNKELNEQLITTRSAIGQAQSQVMRLRSENAQLRKERDFLRSAAAYFAKELPQD